MEVRAADGHLRRRRCERRGVEDLLREARAAGPRRARAPPRATSTSARTRSRRRCSRRPCSGRAEGVPESPRGWLITVAVAPPDRPARAASRRGGGARRLPSPRSAEEPQPDAAGAREHDDTLTLLFLCCHPDALAAVAARADAARRRRPHDRGDRAAPSSSPRRRWRSGSAAPSSASRRGKRVPPRPSCERLDVVLHVLYLIFNEGYTATSGPELAARRADRARRSGSPGCVHRLLPDDGEVAGLLALMLLTDARRPARARRRRRRSSRWPSRTAPAGTRAAIARGRRAGRPTTLARGPVGPYQLQAAIAAVHAEARARRGHRLAADPRALRPARPRSPRTRWSRSTAPSRSGMVHGPARRPRGSSPPSTTTTRPATTASTPSARTCSSRPATATAARDAYRDAAAPHHEPPRSSRYLESRAAP